MKAKLTIFLLILTLISMSLFVQRTQAEDAPNGFNISGNLLITDQFNNRIIEVDRHTKHIVWSFGSGNPALCNPGSSSIIGSNDAERLADGMTLIAGTGVPVGAPSPLGATGC